MKKVQVFNPEMGTKKYVGQLEGFISHNGYVLAILIDENRAFKCEKLTDILVISESEKQDGRINEEGNPGGLVPGPGATDNTGRNGRPSGETKGSKSLLRRG